MAPEVWQPLLWGCGILICILYIFSLVFASAAIDFAGHTSKDELPQRLLKLYGSMGRSMSTLFAAITAGEPWHDLMQPLKAISSVWGFFFQAYVFIMAFGVMNTVAALFFDGLMHRSKVDRDFALSESNAKDRRRLMHIKDLLRQESSEDGYIRFKRLLKVLSNESCSRALRDLCLDRSAAISTFRLLDADNKRLLEVDQFIYGLMQVKGNPGNVHIASMMYQGKRVLQVLSDLTDMIEERVIPLAAGMDPSLILGQTMEGSSAGQSDSAASLSQALRNGLAV